MPLILMLVIHAVISVLKILFFNVIPALCLFSKFTWKRSMHFLTQFPSKWQILRKFAKFALAKVKVFGALRTLWRRIPGALTVTDPGHSLGYARLEKTFSALQIYVIRHRTHHTHSWLHSILTSRNGHFYTRDILINRHSQSGYR